MRVAASVTAATLALLALAGCADDASTQGVTLAVEKSSIQLLRNEAAGRIPADVVQELVQPTDHSLSCKSVSEDPDGLYRTWDSGVLVLLDYGVAQEPDELLDDLVTSFTDQGWETVASDSAAITRLEKSSSFAAIELYTVDPDTRNQVGGQIQIDVTGPCVLTDGPNSLEVRDLEGKN